MALPMLVALNSECGGPRQRPTALNIGPGKFGHDGDDDGGGDDDDEHDDGGDDDQFICQIRQKLNSLTSESLSVPKACEVTVSV